MAETAKPPRGAIRWHTVKLKDGRTVRVAVIKRTAAAPATPPKKRTP